MTIKTKCDKTSQRERGLNISKMMPIHLEQREFYALYTLKITLNIQTGLKLFSVMLNSMVLTQILTTIYRTLLKNVLIMQFISVQTKIRVNFHSQYLEAGGPILLSFL